MYIGIVHMINECSLDNWQNVRLQMIVGHTIKHRQLTTAAAHSTRSYMWSHRRKQQIWNGATWTTRAHIYCFMKRLQNKALPQTSYCHTEITITVLIVKNIHFSFCWFHWTCSKNYVQLHTKWKKRKLNYLANANKATAVSK